MGDTSIFYRSANEDVNKLSLNVLFFPNSVFNCCYNFAAWGFNTNSHGLSGPFRLSTIVSNGTVNALRYDSFGTFLTF